MPLHLYTMEPCLSVPKDLEYSAFCVSSCVIIVIKLNITCICLIQRYRTHPDPKGVQINKASLQSVHTIHVLEDEHVLIHSQVHKLQLPWLM